MPKIKLHPESEELIKKTFAAYTPVALSDSTLEFSGMVILHIYPEADTRDLKTGELKGFHDCLLFRVDIYDCERMTKMSVGSRDGISLNRQPVTVGVFKDGSTFIKINAGHVSIDLYQVVEIR